MAAPAALGGVARDQRWAQQSPSLLQRDCPHVLPLTKGLPLSSHGQAQWE